MRITVFSALSVLSLAIRAFITCPQPTHFLRVAFTAHGANFADLNTPGHHPSIRVIATDKAREQGADSISEI